jgi:prepilin-type N-terminal cleavage/methylation domain-containing protein
MPNKKAFTLVELLVVIGVIALLMAMLLPTLEGARRQAYAIICRTNLRQCSTIFAIYLDDHNGHMLMQEVNKAGICVPWMYSMRDYLDDVDEVLCCPMAKEPVNPSGKVGADITVMGGTFQAWGKVKLQVKGTVTEEYYHGSYGLNRWLSELGGRRGHIEGLGTGTKKWFWETSDVPGPDNNIPVFLDSTWWSAWVKHRDRPPEQEGDIGRFPCACRESMPRFCINRHNGSVNASFMDQSVRSVGLKELWTLKWHREFRTANRWTLAGGVVKPEDWPEWMRKFKDY